MDGVEPEGFRWVNRTWSYACEANSDVVKCAELSFVGFCRMAVERVSPQRRPQNQAGNSGVGTSSSSARRGAGTTAGKLATKVDTTEGGWRLAASCVGGRGAERNRTVQIGKGGGDGDMGISERP